MESNKLYTEEQVIQAFKDGFITAINEATCDYVNEYINELTPIELPSEQDYKNSWSKGCECKNSLGATWCCNSCGLPTNKDYLNSLNKQD